MACIISHSGPIYEHSGEHYRFDQGVSPGQKKEVVIGRADPLCESRC